MRKARLLLLPVIVLVCAGAFAQASPGKQILTPTEIRIGESIAPLAGPWRFAPGDSPVVNEQPAWADSGFDDSSWAVMDLHTKPGRIGKTYGSSGYLAGWSARGYPKLAGFAWYRLRIHVADAGQPLAIKMPGNVDDAFQVFANGKLLGSFGKFTAKRVVCYIARPLVYPLPAPDTNGDILLAIRFYMQPIVLVLGDSPDSGGMHEAPLVGLPTEMEYIRAEQVQGSVVEGIVFLYVALFMTIAAAGAFWIWLLDRPGTTYLWLTLALAIEAGFTYVALIGFFTYGFSQGMVGMLQNNFLRLGLLCWIVFWRRWFQLADQGWVNIGLAAVGAASIATEMYIDFFSDGSSVQTVLAAVEFGAVCKAVLGFILFATLLQSARRDRAGALLAMPPIVLLAISIFHRELLTWVGIRTEFFVSGVGIALGDVAFALMALVVGALVARRFIRSQVAQRLERQTIDKDLEQASELQQKVLIPEPIVSQFFAVKTAYIPARTVGGDFFQVVQRADGSLLIVVGDVSGKGVAAAMLVAVLVGAVRTRADETFDPAAILLTLNDRLLGRAGGHFATCIVAHLRPDGTMTIANAGHIPPYQNGVALDVAGSLPLGLAAGIDYETQTVEIYPEDRLTFVTDGVLEARNVDGELLGFEELARLSSLPPEAIAKSAVAFGQDDDITVVGVRMLIPKTASAMPAVLVASPA